MNFTRTRKRRRWQRGKRKIREERKRGKENLTSRQITKNSCSLQNNTFNKLSPRILLNGDNNVLKVWVRIFSPSRCRDSTFKWCKLNYLKLASLRLFANMIWTLLTTINDNFRNFSRKFVGKIFVEIIC